MKKILIMISLAALAVAGCTKDYDDSALEEKVAALERYAASLVDLSNRINTNIVALKGLAEAVKDNLRVKGMVPVMDGDKVTAYKITLSDNTELTVYLGVDGQDGEDQLDGEPGYNGVDGVPGADGVVPVVTIVSIDGNDYWAIDGNPLKDENGNNIPVLDKTGEQSDGKTPQLKIENGVWSWSYDGYSWTPLTVSAQWGNGNIFTSVTQNEEYVLFTLASGETIQLLKAVQLSLTLSQSSALIVPAAGTAEFTYSLITDEVGVKVEAFVTGFWKAEVDENNSKITVMAPADAVSGDAAQVVVFATTASGLSVYRILEIVVE